MSGHRIDRRRACHPCRMAAQPLYPMDPRMPLEIGSVLGGLGLAVVAFVVVILVCVVILRLVAAILPSYEAPDAARLAATKAPIPGNTRTRRPTRSRCPSPTPACDELPGNDTAETGTHRTGADEPSGR